MEINKNVLGEKLKMHCDSPKTGFYRDGFCRTDKYDTGRHVIASIMTAEFLEFTKSRGNDLMTPNPQNEFPGLKAGDKWCLCALRWLEAHEEGFAPPVILECTHENALTYVSLEVLKKYQR